jgi:hypothetical protein
MSMLETIIVGVITAVLSSLVVEWVRETRKNGKQFLEKAVDFIIDVIKSIAQLIKECVQAL